ncbi:hypothetical protein NQZ68_019156 [Dissostichus eleginoides]|nr:hypothetical protein NQZ68_019156 [Dissostichus eleginoides]
MEEPEANSSGTQNSSRKVRWRNNMKLMLKIKSSVPVQFVVTSILQISCPIMPVHVVKVHLRIYQVHQAVQTELDHIAVRKNMTAFQLLTLMLREWAWTHMKLGKPSFAHKRQQPSSKDIFCGKIRWNPQSGQAWTSGRTKNPKVGKYLPSTKAHKLTGHTLYDYGGMGGGEGAGFGCTPSTSKGDNKVIFITSWLS